MRMPRVSQQALIPTFPTSVLRAVVLFLLLLVDQVAGRPWWLSWLSSSSKKSAHGAAPKTYTFPALGDTLNGRKALSEFGRMLAGTGRVGTLNLTVGREDKRGLIDLYIRPMDSSSPWTEMATYLQGWNSKNPLQRRHTWSQTGQETTTFHVPLYSREWELLERGEFALLFGYKQGTWLNLPTLSSTELHKMLDEPGNGNFGMPQLIRFDKFGNIEYRAFVHIKASCLAGVKWVVGEPNQQQVIRAEITGIQLPALPAEEEDTAHQEGPANDTDESLRIPKDPGRQAPAFSPRRSGGRSADDRGVFRTPAD